MKVKFAYLTTKIRVKPKDIFNGNGVDANWMRVGTNGISSMEFTKDKVIGPVLVIKFEESLRYPDCSVPLSNVASFVYEEPEIAPSA